MTIAGEIFFPWNAASGTVQKNFKAVFIFPAAFTVLFINSA